MAKFKVRVPVKATLEILLDIEDEALEGLEGGKLREFVLNEASFRTEGVAEMTAAYNAYTTFREEDTLLIDHGTEYLDWSKEQAWDEEGNKLE